MAINVNEAVQTIKSIGSHNTRIVPMEGQCSVSGLQQIEVLTDGSWMVLVSGIKRQMAEDIIAQAINKVILG